MSISLRCRFPSWFDFFFSCFVFLGDLYLDSTLHYLLSLLRCAHSIYQISCKVIDMLDWCKNYCLSAISSWSKLDFWGEFPWRLLPSKSWSFLRVFASRWEVMCWSEFKLRLHRKGWGYGRLAYRVPWELASWDEFLDSSLKVLSVFEGWIIGYV